MTKTATIMKGRQALLAVHGPARLTVDAKPVKLRRKGLALLYVLAVDGPTRRERLAEILWGHTRALQNLRVELHRLKDALSPLGIEPFADGSDPLSLAGVMLDRAAPKPTGTSVLLEGLDDISPEFQEWLDRLRDTDAQQAGSHARTALVDELARTITTPFVLVLAGEPGSGRRAVAQDLAGRLGLPFVDGCSGSGPALRYVIADDTTCSDIATTVSNDTDSVWVLQRSLFGEDENVVLQLRATIAPDRMRFTTLEPLDWWSVKSTLPEDVSFLEGARLFLASGGNQQYLNELLELRAMVEPGTPLPVPLRMRAAFALEARRLGDGARYALERASIHHGSLSREVLTAVGAAPHLEELERNGWLAFNGSGWRFSSDLSRRMLEGQLREGTRRRLHAEVADALEKLGATTDAAHHRALSLGTLPGHRGAPASDHGRDTPSVTHVGVGRELWLDDTVSTGSSVRVDGDRVTFSRTASSPDRSRVTYTLSPEPLLLRVRGRAFTEDGLAGNGPDGQATLELSVTGSGARPVHLGHGADVRFGPTGELRMPLQQRFTYWLLAPAGRELRLESSSTGAVIEMKLNAYRPLIAPEEAPTCTIVEAYVLDGFDGAGGKDDPLHERRGNDQLSGDRVLV